MNNLVLHITLPAGIKLTDGSVLGKDVTYDFISSLSPFYASVDAVKLTGGRILRKLASTQDITIACQIYNASQEADLLNMRPPTAGDEYKLFSGARQQYVTALAARDLILQLEDLMEPASHVLANFSVERQKGLQETGMAARLKELNDSLKLYEVSIRSGGRTAPGGRPRARFAAKQVNDWTEITPSRTWIPGVGGAGANATSYDTGSPGGGRGRPIKFYASPIFSPSFQTMRYGTFQSGFPLNLTRPLGY